MGLKIGSNGHIERTSSTEGTIRVDRGVINTIDYEQRRRIILEVLRDISETVGHTLGPFGSFTLLTEPYGASPVVPSKDGFRIMNNIRYDNPIYDSIYRVVRDIAGRMNQLVGDSTTSGNVIAYEFYKVLDKWINDARRKKKIHASITPAGISNILKALEEILIERLIDLGYVQQFNQNGKIMSPEDRTAIYRKVGTVAANNDPYIGNLIADLFSKTHSASTFVNVERADGDQTIVEEDMGFEMNTGHLHRLMATEQDGLTAVYNDPLFLLIDGPLTGHDIHQFGDWVTKICIEAQNPLVVIASEYTQEIMNFFIQARAGIAVPVGNDGQTEMRRLPIIGLIIDGSNDFGNARLRDLECALGANAIPTKDGKLLGAPTEITALLKILGRARKVKTAPFFCRILGGLGQPSEIENRISQLSRDLEHKTMHDSLQFQAHIEMVKKRIAMLSGHMSTIFVGGSTYKEKESARQVYEDAVCAIRSTIEHGYTLGGNVSVPHLIASEWDHIVNDVVAKLIEKKVNVCLGNDERGIADRVNTVLEAIQGTFTKAYEKVLEHAGYNRAQIFKTIIQCTRAQTNPRTFNLMTDHYESFADRTIPDLLVAGNTDVELIRATFAVCLTFLTSDQLMTLYHHGQIK
jgi:chaperonin GroEL